MTTMKYLRLVRKIKKLAVQYERRGKMAAEVPTQTGTNLAVAYFDLARQLRRIV